MFMSIFMSISILCPVHFSLAVTTGDSVDCLALRLRRPRGVFGMDVY